MLPVSLTDVLIENYFREGYTYRLILCFLAGVHGIFISMRTLKRKLHRMGLKRKGNYSSTMDVVDCVQRELHQGGDNLGYRAMHARLNLRYNISISRERLRQMMCLLDPEGVQMRKKRRLRRRMYSSKGPNFCWHMDGNDKILPYGFAIHGCIDGFSRKVLWLEVCTTNKDSSVIAGYYLKAVKKYGCPRMLRCDRGSENAKVAYIQPFLRRHGTDPQSGSKSFQYGRSVSNQRIEQFWGTMRKWCTDWWICFFKMLKEEGHYDETDQIQRDCLIFAFYDIIQRELTELVHMWNTHLIRRGRDVINGIPNELFYLPDMRGYDDCSTTYSDLDMEFTMQYIKEKPFLTVQFLTLTNILIEEENLQKPTTPMEALIFYLDLVHLINTIEY